LREASVQEADVQKARPAREAPAREARPAPHPAYCTYASAGADAERYPAPDPYYAGVDGGWGAGDTHGGGAEVGYGSGVSDVGEDRYASGSGSSISGGGSGGNSNRWSERSGGAAMSALDRRYREMLGQRGLDASVEGDEVWLQSTPPGVVFESPVAPSAPPAG